MKKTLVALMMLMVALCAKAQVTTNVQVGAALNTDQVGITGILQVNIPFKRGGSFTFSPSFEAECTMNDLSDATDVKNNSCSGSRNLLLPLKVGYKVSLGKDLILFPKIGPAIGMAIDVDDKNFNYGPSMELALEYKHFVVALNGYASVSECVYGEETLYQGDTWERVKATRKPYAVSLSFGYKF